jgi:hypothetical protein
VIPLVFPFLAVHVISFPVQLQDATAGKENDVLRGSDIPERLVAIGQMLMVRRKPTTMHGC